MRLPNLIVDFDSTFVSVESLDVLAEIVLAEFPERATQVRRLTARAMAGELDFAEALGQRLALIAPRRVHLDALVERLHEAVSPSFVRNRGVLGELANRIWIVSGGFHEFIDPVVARFGLRVDHVLANRFRFAGDAVIGFDADEALARERGKVDAVAALNLARPIIAVGDGMSDYQLLEAGVVDHFVVYTENVRRAAVCAHAGDSANDIATLLDSLVSKGATAP